VGAADGRGGEEVTLERIVRFRPAYDKWHPDPHKNYGIHGVDLLMVLKGPLGAVHFVLFTNWHLPHVQEELEARGTAMTRPTPADFGYHSITAQYEDQHCRGECEWLDGRPCYSDGSGLYAEKVYERLLREGDEGVWSELEAYYREKFETEREEEQK
jgi:hypothetical protein